MKRIVFSILLLMATSATAQWNDTKFPAQVLTFGVHDANVFIGIVPFNDPFSVFDSLIFQYQGEAWEALGKGIDRTQGNITSFTSLGRYFFAGQTFSNGPNAGEYRSSDNGVHWDEPQISSPVGTIAGYLFGQTQVSIAPYPMVIARSKDSGIIWDSMFAIGPFNNLNGFCSQGRSIIGFAEKGTYRSVDNGGTWEQVSSPITNIKSFAATSNNVYGTNGTQMIISNDSGATWSVFNTTFNAARLATDGTHLFVGGTNGIYLLNDDGTWTNEGGDAALSGKPVVAMGVFDTTLFADFFINPAYKLYSRSIPEMTTKGAVANIVSQDTLAVYPNPSGNFITIDGGSQALREVSVLNVLGATVLRQEGHSNSLMLDLSKLPSGTYYLVISRITGVVVRKVIRE
jgi:hypothetical protein